MTLNGLKALSSFIFSGGGLSLHIPVTSGGLLRESVEWAAWAQLPTRGNSSHVKANSCCSHTPWFKTRLPLACHRPGN